MFLFEHKNKPLIPAEKFYQRLLNNFLIAIGIICFSLGLGVVGYMKLAGLSFADAMLNASMILSGMGPVDIMPDDRAKYFSSFYALFSGITFLSTIAILLAPALHRALHRFHLETEEEEEEEEKKQNGSVNNN